MLLRERQTQFSQVTSPRTPNREFLTCFKIFKIFLERLQTKRTTTFLRLKNTFLFAQCSTHEYYILTQSCILKLPTSNSFRGLKSPETNLENQEESISYFLHVNLDK